MPSFMEPVVRKNPPKVYETIGCSTVYIEQERHWLEQQQQQQQRLIHHHENDSAKSPKSASRHMESMGIGE
jgi:hypothetical protein